MRRPPNLHLHSFQRISQEWNGEASKVQSLFRLSRRGERRPRASLRQARRSKSVPRRIRKGASEWRPRGRPLSCVQTTKSFLRGYAARPAKSRPEKQPEAALETSPPPPSTVTKTPRYIKGHVGKYSGKYIARRCGVRKRDFQRRI